MHRIANAVLAAALLLPIAGCASRVLPAVTTREVLGTAVTVTAYSADKSGTKRASENAFAAITAVEREFSPYDASSTISAFNRAPLQRRALPPDARAILARSTYLGVDTQFSPALFGITSLYDFGSTGTVPTLDVLRSAVRASSTFRVGPDGTASFDATQDVGSPGLDFGGASKGLALDRAAVAMAGLPTLLTAGSSTLAFGSKPDGQPWRVGIEDPREVGRVLAIVSSEGTLSVSTSGDYQTYFERDGTRYHHILDPSTGRPAAGGIRSVTVFGRMSGLDADILSTALFVMGREAAIVYASDHGIGLYLVDESGHPHTSEPRGGPTLKFLAEPRH